MENSDIIFFRIQSQFFGNVSTLCRNEFRNAKVILRWEYGNNHEKWAESIYRPSGRAERERWLPIVRCGHPVEWPIGITQLLCDHFQMSKSDLFGGQGNKNVVKNLKKNKVARSCLKWRENWSKMFFLIFDQILFWTFKYLERVAAAH